MEKLRILFLITDLGKGGAERYLIDLCTWLQKISTIEFVIASLYDNNQYPEEARTFNIVNLHFNTFSFWKKNECIELKKLIDTFKPHVIHTHRFLAEFVSSYYVRKDIVYVCHGHDNMEQFANFHGRFLLNKKKILQWIEKRYLFWKKYSRVNTHIIANSRDTFQYFNQVLGKSKIQLHLIYNGFNYEKFFVEQQNKSISYPIKLINVGSFQPKKNQSFLVKVGIELRRRNIPFHMTLYGDGELRNDVLKLIKENNLEEYIEAPGIVHEVHKKYSENHLYIHSAWYEPFGLVFLEAMASGLPIVTLDGKGNRDLIDNDKNGYLISEQREKIFVDKIMELYNNQKKYQTMSKYAQQYAKQFDMNEHIKKILTIYRSKA